MEHNTTTPITDGTNILDIIPPNNGTTSEFMDSRSAAHGSDTASLCSSSVSSVVNSPYCSSSSSFSSSSSLRVSVPLWFRFFSKRFDLVLTARKSSAIIRITALDFANRWRRRTSAKHEKTITALEKPELVSTARHAKLKVWGGSEEHAEAKPHASLFKGSSLNFSSAIFELFLARRKSSVSIQYSHLIFKPPKISRPQNNQELEYTRSGNERTKQREHRLAARPQ